MSRPREGIKDSGSKKAFRQNLWVDQRSRGGVPCERLASPLPRFVLFILPVAEGGMADGIIEDATDMFGGFDLYSPKSSSEGFSKALSSDAFLTEVENTRSADRLRRAAQKVIGVGQLMRRGGRDSDSDQEHSSRPSGNLFVETDKERRSEDSPASQRSNSSPAVPRIEMPPKPSELKKVGSKIGSNPFMLADAKLAAEGPVSPKAPKPTGEQGQAALILQVAARSKPVSPLASPSDLSALKINDENNLDSEKPSEPPSPRRVQRADAFARTPRRDSGERGVEQVAYAEL